MILRRLIPLIALSTGIGSLAYGVLSHRVPIYEERETQISIPIASPFAAAFAAEQAMSGGGLSPFEANGEPEERSPFEPVEEQPDGQSPPEMPEERSPFEPVDEQSPFAQSEMAEPLEGPPLPFAQSGPMSQTVFELELVSREESELVLVREVTFGGLTRLANGQVRRTYCGASPTMCPT